MTGTSRPLAPNPDTVIPIALPRLRRNHRATTASVTTLVHPPAPKASRMKEA
jgi:hypothetical protein